MLRESECLDEQGDILQYLVDTQGLNYDTGKWMFQPSGNLTDNYISVTFMYRGCIYIVGEY